MIWQAQQAHTKYSARKLNAHPVESIPKSKHTDAASIIISTHAMLHTVKKNIQTLGDQVSRISFDFLKWRSMGPQKPATIIGHKYSIFKRSKK